MRYRISVAALLYVAGLGEATGQQNPFRLAEKLMLDRDGRLDYVAPLRGLATANQQAFDSDMYGQALATYRSFVGKITRPAPISSTTPFTLAEGGATAAGPGYKGGAHQRGPRPTRAPRLLPPAAEPIGPAGLHNFCR